jgi:hypothetical protein
MHLPCQPISEYLGDKLSEAMYQAYGSEVLHLFNSYLFWNQSDESTVYRSKIDEFSAPNC